MRASPLLALLLLGCPVDPDAGFGGQQPPLPGEDPTPGEPKLADETTLISVDESLRTIMVLDALTGEGRAAVPLAEGFPGSCSTVFTRGGTLYMSSGDRLWRMDPCTGEGELVGQYPDGALICGMAARDLNDLYGLDVLNGQLVSIDPNTAELTELGWTGVYWQGHGLTWDEVGERFLAINGAEDTLYELDPDTGEATWLTELDHDFGAVGVEVDPVSGTLFGCTTGNRLLAVDAPTGHVTELGQIGPAEDCNDLGATWIPVPCLEE